MKLVRTARALRDFQDCILWSARNFGKQAAYRYKVLLEIARTLKPDGRLLLVDMLPHEDESYRDRMGHVRLGFDSETLYTFCREAGLSCDRVDTLPTDPEARGPALFSAVARRIV